MNKEGSGVICNPVPTSLQAHRVIYDSRPFLAFADLSSLHPSSFHEIIFTLVYINWAYVHVHVHKASTLARLLRDQHPQSSDSLLYICGHITENYDRETDKDIQYPHFSGDARTDCTRPFFLPHKKWPGNKAKPNFH